MQVPFWHVSVCVHMLPSLHVVPFVAFVGVEQVPVEELQVPATWHAVAAGQVTGLLPVQVPLWHVSVCVQALPSEQLLPFAAATQVAVVAAQVIHVPHAAPAFCHVPLLSHVCGCDPLQVFAPGAQLPVQAPLAAVHT